MVKIYVGTSDAVLDRVVTVFKSDPSGWLGPLYVGACLGFIFLGILFCQVRSYYSKFPKDSVWIKYLVAAILVFSVLKSILDFVAIWDRNIAVFGSWREAAKVKWGMYMGGPSAVLISSTAQLFFVWRAFTLTGRNWYLMTLLALLMMAAAGLNIALSVYAALDPYYAPRLVVIEVPMFIVSSLVDIIITGVVCYKLAKSRRGFNRQTDKALSQMLALTWECAAPPALSQLITLILFTTLLKSNRSTWLSTFIMLTPRLYAFSLLYSLNARVGINTTLSQGTSGWHSGTQRSGINQQSRKGSNGGGAMALSTLKEDRAALESTIPIHVATETVVHTSPTDGYKSGRGKPWSTPNHTMDIGAEELNSCPTSKSKEEDIESVGSSLGG